VPQLKPIDCMRPEAYRLDHWSMRLLQYYYYCCYLLLLLLRNIIADVFAWLSRQSASIAKSLMEQTTSYRMYSYIFLYFSFRFFIVGYLR